MPDIPSVANLRKARARSLLPNADENMAEELFTLADLIKEQREGCGKAVYTPQSIQAILEQFLASFLAALAAADVILTWRSHQFTATDELLEADAQVEALRRELRQQQEQVAAYLGDMRSLEDGTALRSLHPAALLHLRWLVHRHSSRSVALHVQLPGSQARRLLWPVRDAGGAWQAAGPCCASSVQSGPPVVALGCS